MKLHVLLFIIGMLVTFFSAGCSEKKVTLRPGFCYSNEDCTDGLVCRENWCEDIYHPRKTIKNY